MPNVTSFRYSLIETTVLIATFSCVCCLAAVGVFIENFYWYTFRSVASSIVLFAFSNRPASLENLTYFCVYRMTGTPDLLVIVRCIYAWLSWFCPCLFLTLVQKNIAYFELGACVYSQWRASSCASCIFLSLICCIGAVFTSILITFSFSVNFPWVLTEQRSVCIDTCLAKIHPKIILLSLFFPL